MRIKITYKETPGGDLPYFAEIKYVRDSDPVTIQTITHDVLRWFEENLSGLVKKYGRAEKVDIVGEAPLLRENKEFIMFVERDVL